jgi:uncharacterized protein YtpQ (UPF0354 family)
MKKMSEDEKKEDNFLKYLNRRKWEHFHQHRDERLRKYYQEVAGHLNIEIQEIIANYKEFLKNPNKELF